MKKVLIGLIALIAIFSLSCEKEPTETVVKEVTFTLNVNEFQVMTTGFGSLKSANAQFDFEHKYKGCVLTFTNSDGIAYVFNTASTPLDSFKITLPVGDYTLSGNSDNASSLGQPTMSFTIPSQTISVIENTIQLDVTLTPTCALVLVSDEENLLNSAYIYYKYMNNSAQTRNLYIENTLRYSYFKPYPNPDYYSIRLFKDNGSYLIINTNNLKIGYIYKIIVTDVGTTQVLELDPTFQETEPIGW